MITLFTTSKPFIGEDRIRQYNAIGSWKRLHPDVEILLFGRGEGYEDAIRDLGLVPIPDVETSEKGCPRVDAMFAIAKERGKYELKAYLNSDIIIMPNVLSAALKVEFSHFLLIGERWGLRVDAPLDFSSDWEGYLRRLLQRFGLAGRVTAIDMFIYRGDIWGDVPPMVVGRAGYDNYLLFYCRQRGVPVVDLTGQADIIHQEHAYHHIVGGVDEVFTGIEAQENIRLAGGWDNLFTIEDADWRLTSEGVARNYARGDSKRWATACGILYRNRGWRAHVPRWVWQLEAEWGIRCQMAEAGNVAGVVKFPLWILKRIFQKQIENAGQ